jgi:hypothetical protein
VRLKVTLNSHQCQRCAISTADAVGRMTAGRMRTNTFLRRLQNFCAGMNWLAFKLWPRIKCRKKRAIKHEEHVKIIAREKNAERRAFYELCWYLGDSQSDIANLDAEDVD